MLPFLKKEKSSPGIIMATMSPEGKMSEGNDSSEGLEAVARDLLDAINAKDVKLLASALMAAIEICQSEPSDADSEG